MKLYLTRHGDYNSPNIDPDKGLSETGINQINSIAEFLKKSEINIAEIWHSGKTRAAQSAELLSQTINPQLKPIQKNGLNPTDPAADIVSEIEFQEQDILIAGHLPSLSSIASLLTTGHEVPDMFNLSASSTIILEKNEDNWQVNSQISPQQAS